MMQLYWCPQTRASRAVWMLEEAGCDYEKVLIDIRDPDARSRADFQAVSPLGKVPALRDGDVAVAESAAICLYVADRYSPGTLAPAIDDPTRGDFLFWLMFTPGVIEPCMAEAFGTAQANRVSHGWGDWDSMIATLEARMEDRTWVMGDRFTAADVLVGSSVRFMQLFGIMPDSDILKAYHARCEARPALQRAVDEPPLAEI